MQITWWYLWEDAMLDKWLMILAPIHYFILSFHSSPGYRIDLVYAGLRLLVSPIWLQKLVTGQTVHSGDGQADGCYIPKGVDNQTKISHLFQYCEPYQGMSIGPMWVLYVWTVAALIMPTCNMVPQRHVPFIRLWCFTNRPYILLSDWMEITKGILSHIFLPF